MWMIKAPYYRCEYRFPVVGEDILPTCKHKANTSKKCHKKNCPIKIEEE